MSANDKQVAGQHYRSQIQHWDYVVANELDYFQAQITKYVTRWKKKNGFTDLEKAQHFLEKYMEVVKFTMEGLAKEQADKVQSMSDEEKQRRQNIARDAQT